MRAILALCDRLHRATDGRFDPIVQPLWRALAEGRDTEPARAANGWGRVRLGDAVRLGAGQALTMACLPPLVARGIWLSLIRNGARLRSAI